VALLSPLIHVKGYSAPETKAAAERAHLLIEKAEAIGEPPRRSLLLFSVLYSFSIANYVAFNGDAYRERSAQFGGIAGVGNVSAMVSLVFRSRFGAFVSAGKIPFPGNRDFGSKRRDSTV
jgi:hypothetical protein